MTTLIEGARHLAGELPATTIEAVASVLETVPGKAARDSMHAVVAHPHYRTRVLDFVDTWRKGASDVDGRSAALILRTAAHCHAAAEGGQRLSLVCTGPDVKFAYRYTQPALLDLMAHAKSHLTIVSFVVYKVPAVVTAVAEAARRGVEVRIIVEDAEASEGKVALDALTALGSDIAARSRVYVWPIDKRPKDKNGQHGSLHAKCAVADDDWLLISSANLTAHAFTLNLELGVLVRGGPLPARVDAYFDTLIATGTLKKITS